METSQVTCGSCISYQRRGNGGRDPQTPASPVMAAGRTAAGVAQDTQPEGMMCMQDCLLAAAAAATGEKLPLALPCSLPSEPQPQTLSSHCHGGFWPAPQAHRCCKSAALCTTLEKIQLFSLPLHRVLCLCLAGLEESGPWVLFRA